ncbi:sensor histidine kinase [Fusibacter bizertensis]
MLNNQRISEAKKRTVRRNRLNWRWLFIIVMLTAMISALAVMVLPKKYTVKDGKADLTIVDFDQDKLVSLDGNWHFYWNKMLMQENASNEQSPIPDSLMKVPGIWSANEGTNYSKQGFATYRLSLEYPSKLKDPAIRVQYVANAYKLYVNGKLVQEVGSNLTDKSRFKNDDKIAIIELPKDTQKVVLIFQVGNLNCATAGLRAAPVFGSLKALEQQHMNLLILQLIFIGGVSIFGIHYFFLFFMDTKNKTALLFSVFCFITAARSMGWGEIPIQILWPDVSAEIRMYLNYLTGYNYVAIVILFVQSIYPLEVNKKVMVIFFVPSLVFDVLLMITNPQLMTFYTNYLYIVLLLQMIYMIAVLIKAVLNKRENAILMFIAACVLIWAMNEDILNFLKIGSYYFSCMFLFGNFAFILTMSYIQARQQAANHDKLIEYNEKLLEADKLKDQIMATEMSFLQAQIKPHFLYNALSAIANVCEKNNKQAGKLILDLAVYLRRSLEFNNLDKLVTVEKELEFVDTYFHIEQARFGQKIQLHKEIEVSLDIKIPVLILQPLVENAVRHGISKNEQGGTVTLRMYMNDSEAIIEIEDDGVGIDADKLLALLSEDAPMQGVGLHNIHSRLLKLYRKGLSIKSKSGNTLVKLSIPEVLSYENSSCR